MQAQASCAKCLAAIFLAIGTVAPLPSYSQGTAYPPRQWVAPPPFALGMASGAQFGAHVSAANPTIRHFGRQPFSHGAHFDPRPIVAGALIGGLLGALSAPAYYQPPSLPTMGSLQLTSDPPLVNSNHGAWIADNWQQFGNPGRNGIETNRANSSPFVEKWQQFFEPAR